jgi:hypothetical protein
MSDNSGSEVYGTPILNGYTVTWDVTIGEWVARSNSSDTTLHGRNQAELDAARWELVVGLADELSQILREAPECGYSPPRYEAPVRPTPPSTRTG